MMKKHDKHQVKSVMKMLDTATRRYGLKLTKYAATKWVNAQTDKARLSKQQKYLERELADIAARLRG